MLWGKQLVAAALFHISATKLVSAKQHGDSAKLLETSHPSFAGTE